MRWKKKKLRLNIENKNKDNKITIKNQRNLKSCHEK